MKVGDIDVQPVIDGVIVSRLPASKPYPDEDSDAWREQHGMFRSDGMVESTVGGFLVRTADRVVLVDAGIGRARPGYEVPIVDPHDETSPYVQAMLGQGLPREALPHVVAHFNDSRIERGRLPASLDALGVAPGDITDVIATHLHFDHIGWLSDDGQPFFPNATVRCAAPDLEFFMRERQEHFLAVLYEFPETPERLAPITDRIETWDTDRNLFPGVDVRLAPGHTPGSSVVVLSDGAARAMLLGDMVHCPLELSDDDFDLLVDVDMDLAQRMRVAYARELEGSDIPVAASHFPELRFGRLLPGEGARRWTFDLS
jgi:glyoxylase-like metal-dependent hydrolase (beta-lactamase superfamily II)